MMITRLTYESLVTADHRDDFLIWKVIYPILRLMITCLTGINL